MERMLKNNNGLTVINTLLLVVVTWLCYVNYQSNATEDKKIDAINTALYYKLGIVPYEPSEHRSDGRQESKRNILNSDVALVHETLTSSEKKVK